MRIVKVYEPMFIPDNEHWAGGEMGKKLKCKGYFHRFTQDEGGDTNAVVELEDGTIIEPLACRVQFIEEMVLV